LANIYDVVDKQRAALLKREYDTVKRLVRAYEVAQLKVEKSIKLFQLKIENAQAAGLTPSLSWYYQEARLENILREIRGHLDEYAKDAVEFASTARDDAYQLGAVHALRLAEAQVYGDIAGLHSTAFANAQALLSGTSPLKKLFDDIGPTATTSARALFAEAIAEGWNPRKLGVQLASQIDGLVNKRGVLIARTEIIRSYRTANTDVYKRNADVIRGWRWTAAKTAATCAMCLALDGEIFPVDQTLSSHPACRCSMVPLPNTDFGGPQPQSGEKFFQNLSEREQNATLGKGKAEMYRAGQITLKDNIHWVDSPEWGRQPASRRLDNLKAKYLSNELPSQRGYLKVSSFEPRPAQLLSDLLTEAERSANDPVVKALDKWAKVPTFKSGDKKLTFPTVKKAPYKALAKDLKSLDSTIEDVELSSMTSTLRWIGDDKVKAMISNLGDGPDLPVVFRSNGRLYIHNGDSVARLQAKAMLGQTKASVRVFDADALVVTKSPLDLAKEAVQALGVKKIEIRAGVSDADAVKSLEWAADRFKVTGVVPNNLEVWNGSTTGVSGTSMVVGTDLSDYVAEDIVDTLNNSWMTRTSGDATIRQLKTKTVQVSLDRAENTEAKLYASRFTIDSVKAEPLLDEFAKQRYNLISHDAFALSAVDDAVKEAVILYRRGEYRLGSLPEEIEKAFLKQAQTIIGKKKTLPAFTDSENILFHQIGQQAGSNPGGKYLGMDGVERYVKFYDNPERSMVELIANSIYEANGINVPKALIFDHGAKKAFATEIIESNQTIASMGGVSGVDVGFLKDAFDGYLTDAFLSNWDVIGTDEANMVIAGGRVFRIDNGGTFIFRARGGDKAQSILTSFDDFWTLAGPSGQYGPVLKRLGFDTLEDAEALIKVQAKKLSKTLDKIATTDSGWRAYFDKLTGGALSDTAKGRMAEMMIERRKLLDAQMTQLEARAKARKAALKAAGKAKKKPLKMKGAYLPDGTRFMDANNIQYDEIVNLPIWDQLDPALTKAENYLTGTGTQDESLKQIIELQNRAGKPKAATKADIDVADWVAFRGVSEEKFAKDYYDGDLFHGLGYYGSGTYTASIRKTAVGSLKPHRPDALLRAIDEAKGYAESRSNNLRGVKKGLISMLVEPDALVVSHNDMTKIQSALQRLITSLERAAHIAGDTATIARLASIHRIAQDEGRLAAILGFDGIDYWQGEGMGSYLVLLHRQKVRVMHSNAWTHFYKKIMEAIERWTFKEQ
jgi:SPP1 gp7 family putative phage head morphogenesis protein